MKRTILIVVILALVGWAVFEFVSGSDSAEQDPDVGLEVGDKAPNFTLDTMEGDPVELADLEGEKVLVNFWATWCPPCRAEIPDLNDFHDDTDITILGINLTDTEDSADNIAKFVKNFEMEFPILMDEESEVSSKYEIQPIPSSFMIDSQGVIQYKALGAMNYDLMIEEYEKMD